MSVCFGYVPGVFSTATDYIATGIPVYLNAQGIPFRYYDIEKPDLIQAHAARLQVLVQAQVTADPNLRFHWIGHSMGGLILRYFMAHCTIEHPTLGSVPPAQLALTVTTMSTPHHGTPLAAKWEKLVYPAGAQMTVNTRIWDDPLSPVFSPMQFPYFCIVNKMTNPGSNKSDWFPWLLIAAQLFPIGEPVANDTVVPTYSQYFGEVIQTVPYHHNFCEDSGPAPLAFWVSLYAMLQGRARQIN